jgi:peptidoglycan/LPS O-acetylase OafA/YrhL
MGRRDGFREATVIAVTIFGVGATIVHAIDIIETGNLAPGNTIQNISNLLKPALLIGFLAASRRAERSPESEIHASGFDTWRGPRIQAAALVTGSIAAGFSVGFAVDQTLIGTLVGMLVGAGLATLVIARSSRRTGRVKLRSPNAP